MLVLPLLYISVGIPASMLLFVILVLSIYLVLGGLSGKDTALAFAFYSVFLLVSGSVFAGLICLLTGIETGMWWALTGAFVLAWLAGLLTPGAPAGVGVRELVLFFLLKEMVSEVDLVLAIVLGRMVTVLGDVLFYLGVVLMPKRYQTK